MATAGTLAAARRRLPAAMVVGAALVVSLPLLRSGLPQTHDGLFHYYRLAALDQAIRGGCLFPRWFPDFAYGYGQPVLLFYGPASYYAAWLFHAIGLPLSAALKASLASATVLAGLGMYGLARRSMGAWPAGLAGLAYLAFPYRLADLYVRGAFAEHWGLALLPLLLLVTGLAGRHGRSRGYVRLALLWALLILTHNLSALLVAPVWALYAVWTHWRRPRQMLLLGLAAAAGILLSTYYLLPIPAATKLVGLGNTFSTDAWSRYLTSWSQALQGGFVYRYFPAQGTAHHYPLGVSSLAVLALAATAIAAASARRRVHPRVEVVFFVAVAVLPWLMQLQMAAGVWRQLPLLGFVQFPWRLLGLTGLGLAWLIGAGLAAAGDMGLGVRWRAVAGGIVGSGLLATSMLALPMVSVTVPDSEAWTDSMNRNDASIGQVGATWTAEYMPVWVTVDRSIIGRDPVASDRPPAVRLPASTRVTTLTAGDYAFSMDVESSEGFRLAWHAFAFPGWRVNVDGERVAVSPYTDLGLGSLLLPAGRHRVDVAWRDELLWLGARGVSALVAAVLAAIALSRGRRLLAVAAALTAGAAVIGLTGCYARAEPVRPAWAVLDGKLALTGWSVDESAPRQGSAIAVSTHWLAMLTPEEDYKLFLHLVAPDGHIVAQSDGDPVGGYTPTRRLVGGEVFEDARSLKVPEDAEAGTYSLYAGAYRWPDVRNLRVSVGEQMGAERVLLGHVKVLGR